MNVLQYRVLSSEITHLNIFSTAISHIGGGYAHVLIEFGDDRERSCYILWGLCDSLFDSVKIIL